MTAGRAGDMRALKRRLERDGFRFAVNGKGHWEIFSPEGELVATAALTPGDARWKQNVMSHIKRWYRRKGQEAA